MISKAASGSFEITGLQQNAHANASATLAALCLLDQPIQFLQET